MTAIVDRIPGCAGDVRTLVVFNSLGFPRTDWVESEVYLQSSEGIESVEVQDLDGNAVQVQVLDLHRGASGELLRLRLGFIAGEVPAFGHRTYRMVRSSMALSDSEPTKLNAKVAGEFLWENAFHRARMTNGGLVEFFDKRLRRNLLAPDFYLGCEIVEMGSPGHDVGEGERDVTHYRWNAVRPFQPVAQGVERTGDRATSPEIVEDGPLRTRVRTESQFTNCRVVQTITFYRDLDRLEATIDIRQWSGAHGRELRLMFPTGEPEVEISYDVPFGHVVVGESEFPGFADLRPREAQSWLHAGGANTRLTMASSVIAHDWKDPLQATDRHVLQAILLATKRSCHPKGPWYTQEGNHTFHVALSGAPETVSDRIRFGAATGKSMDVVTRVATGVQVADSPKSATDGAVSIDAANVMISSLRLLDEGGYAAVRCWECEGLATETTMRFDRSVRELISCNAIDEEQSVVWAGKTPATEIPVSMRPFEIATLKARFAG
jgi:alpha-mannosidase